MTENRFTSDSHPHKIYKIIHMDYPGAGTISIASCPGKIDEKWCRDLGVDLQHTINCGVNVIICLLEWAEMAELGLVDYPHIAQRCGICFYHFPVIDGRAPKQKHLNSLLTILSNDFNEGKHIMIHCRCGLGRAGVIAACSLLHCGMDPEMAIQFVRSHRPKAIQTDRQEKCIYDHYNEPVRGIFFNTFTG